MKGKTGARWFGLGGMAAGAMLAMALSVPVMGQDAGEGQSEAAVMRVPTGQKQKIKGVILKRDIDRLLVRDERGMEVVVNLGSRTKVEEKKSNPFRSGRNYATTELMRGLSIEVEGRGESDGALLADKIKFTDDALTVARTVETRVTPVEGRVSASEVRLSQAEQNAERLSGQLEELQQISNAARGGAKAAQDTADAAMAGVHQANERISTLVTDLDEYEASKAATVNFKVNSSRLSPEATATLDEIAAQAKAERGYVIEVQGFASADGKADLNRRLSQQRADAVVRYLAETHMIPLRRIITPFGYGAAQPVADNSTREGREMNRRVEVRILVNRGLNSPAPATNRSAVNDITSVDTNRMAADRP
jgi:outer membrane protein OmpA-like peptidoglycan-associated protein